MALTLYTPFLNNLGWSLAHSIWQAGICWLLYTGITRNGTKYSAVFRQDLAILFKAIILIVSGINFLGAVDYSDLLGIAQWGGSFSERTIFAYADTFDKALAWVVLLYLMGVSILLVRFTFQYRHTQNLKHTELIKIPAGFRIFIEKNKITLGITKPISLWLSTKIETPLTIGFWKPIILIPVAALNQLSTDQIEAILLHELQHIRRNDYLINLILTITDILFFFNPFCMQLSKCIQRERENNCDDLVLQYRHHPENYASALLILERNRSSYWSSLALEATGHRSQFLLQRIKRILTGQNESIRTGNKLIALFSITLLILFSFFFIKSTNSTATAVWNDDIYFLKQQLALTLPQEQQEATLLKKSSSFKPEEAVSIQHLTAEPFTETEVPEFKMPGNYIDVNEERLRDYSWLVPDLKESPMKRQMEGSLLPFVPENSFNYQITKDTMNPPLIDSIVALERLVIEKTKALQEIGLLAPNEMGKKLAITSKALELKEQYLQEVQRYNEALKSRKQRQQQVEQMILQEHFDRNESLRKAQLKKLSDSLRVKPIVII